MPKKRHFRQLIIIYIAILCLGLFGLSMDIATFKKSHSMGKLKKEIATLSHENKKMELLILQKTSPDQVYEHATTTLQMIRPDKITYIKTP
jgi:cell division protein FtsB